MSSLAERLARFLRWFFDSSPNLVLEPRRFVERERS